MKKCNTGNVFTDNGFNIWRNIELTVLETSSQAVVSIFGENWLILYIRKTVNNKDVKHRVALVKADVSQERITSVIRVLCSVL
jgi:hypothetical protein